MSEIQFSYLIQRMKIVTLETEHAVMYGCANGEVLVFARVPFTKADRDIRLRHAHMIAASLLLFDALDDLIEEEQPNDWDILDGEGNHSVWCKAFNAHAAALGRRDLPYKLPQFEDPPVVERQGQ